MNRRKQRSGMTLTEVLMVVAVIGLLSMILVPTIEMARRYRENSTVAHQLRTAIQAFEMYRGEEGEYPPDRMPAVTPPEMADYFDYLDIDWWAETTEVGGRWDWDNGYHFPYSISISVPTAKVKQLVDLDKMIDDGSLSSGKFRAVGSQYHYILEE